MRSLKCYESAQIYIFEAKNVRFRERQSIVQPEDCEYTFYSQKQVLEAQSGSDRFVAYQTQSPTTSSSSGVFYSKKHQNWFALRPLPLFAAISYTLTNVTADHCVQKPSTL